MKTAPLICIDRHRLTIDGEGVTTLVAFHGCPLHCKYCLNPQCLEADGVWQEMDTELLMMNVEMDNLYFLATGGGICFGGGNHSCEAHSSRNFASNVLRDGSLRWRRASTCLAITWRKSSPSSTPLSSTSRT